NASRNKQGVPGFYTKNENMPGKDEGVTPLEKYLLKFIEEFTKKQDELDKLVEKSDASIKIEINNIEASLKRYHKIDFLMIKPYVKPYEPPIPYPHRLIEEEDEYEQALCLERVTRMKINKPFVNKLKNAPKDFQELKDAIKRRPS
ncbi:hypothetical protein Tco_0382458, partial [Tanacetum coccineum]